MTTLECATSFGIYLLESGIIGHYFGIMTSRTALVNKALAHVLRGAYTTEEFTLPQIQAATDPQIPWRTLQRIMAGEAPITMGQLENIANAIGRDPKELFEDALKKADRDEMSEASNTPISLDEKRKARKGTSESDVTPREKLKRVAKKQNPELGRDEPSST